jgi:hypothetical protein
MSAALIIVYACLVVVEVAVIVVWVVETRKHRWPVRPSTGDVVIGGATSFLDTLGIGNYAQITALFKLRGHPPDELIPGTLNVGNAVGILFSAVLFITAVQVEPVLLMAMVISAGAGAWIGAGIVSRMRRRVIQVFMGVALLLAAGFFTSCHIRYHVCGHRHAPLRPYVPSGRVGAYAGRIVFGPRQTTSAVTSDEPSTDRSIRARGQWSNSADESTVALCGVPVVGQKNLLENPTVC